MPDARSQMPDAGAGFPACWFASPVKAPALLAQSKSCRPGRALGRREASWSAPARRLRRRDGALERAGAGCQIPDASSQMPDARRPNCQSPIINRRFPPSFPFASHFSPQPPSPRLSQLSALFNDSFLTYKAICQTQTGQMPPPRPPPRPASGKKLFTPLPNPRPILPVHAHRLNPAPPRRGTPARCPQQPA
jgi:hypothetical protein